MTPAQLALVTDRILRCIDRIMETADGPGDGDRAKKPAVPGWNSLAGIAWHVIANAEENILGVAGGQAVLRTREYEFVDNSSRTAAELQEHWRDLRRRLGAYFATLTLEALDDIREHRRRGRVTVLELLLVVLRHAAEHEGHAQMTRDYIRGGYA